MFYTWQCVIGVIVVGNSGMWLQIMVSGYKSLYGQKTEYT
jgi:hypothetical protein